MLFINAQAQTAPRSPKQYLGYELGAQFTPHAKVLGYVKQVAEYSPLVSYQKYGETNEGRELGIVKVSSEQNQSRLQKIRTNNLKRTGLMKGQVNGKDIPIVWLSYNVHGNEASSSEAAMKTLYELVRPDRLDTKKWLEHTVVIIDPMMNPDGRDRYVHWYKETAGDSLNVHPAAREHHEPWPGGRTNHYYFDLNRDWAWLTQKESRARVAAYQKWMPEIHVDFHEQGINSPYYFAPAAKPFHKAITHWQRQFQFTIGKNNARHFDQHNWRYFTREEFDLFYPSYGDTYPLFNGAIGMTYEQAGNGRAGRGIIKADGDTLTLRDRLMHHYTTGMATIETASEHVRELVDHFEAYFKQARNHPQGSYKSFVIRNDSTARLRSLLKLLDKQEIRYGHVRENDTYQGFNYRDNKNEKVEVHQNDILVSAYQPKSVLARVLFEPKPDLTDSLTYDITAWALPYAYGVKAFAIKDRLEGTPFKLAPARVDNHFDGKPYAYLADWRDQADVKFLAALLKKDVQVRAAGKPFRINGRSYARGTLIIMRHNNEKKSHLDTVVQQMADQFNEQLHAVSTGFVKSGPDFGSSSMKLITPPRVALLSGPGTSAGNVGEVWHYFDRQINYPITLISTDYFKSINLTDYDVLILPSGYYGDRLSKKRWKQIKQWVKSGGSLISVGGANRMLADQKGFALKKKEDDKKKKDEAPSEKLKPYSQRQRERASDSNPGAVFKVEMDSTHPLAYGYGEDYYSLKRGTDAYRYLSDGWNVGALQDGTPQSGFVGSKARRELNQSLVFGVQNMGRGSVIYMVDNPLFRAFWHSGKLLFGNAVFMVGD